MRSPGFAIALLAAALAGGCGEVKKLEDSDRDGGGDDDDPDAAGEPGTVTISVTNPFNEDTAPVEDADILFLDPDGSVNTQTTTDADGDASGRIAPGGSVVVVYPPTSGTGAPTSSITMVIVEVQPGDEIVIGTEFDQGEELGTMSFNLPPLVVADTFQVATGCGSSGGFAASPVPLAIESGCVDENGDFDYLATALSGGVPVAFIPGTAHFVAAGMVTPDNPADWADAEHYGVEVTNAVGVVNASVDVGPSHAGLDYGFTLNATIDAIDDVIEGEAPVPEGIERHSEIRLFAAQPNLGQQDVEFLEEADSSRLEVDLEDILLPYYTDALYSAADHTVTWNRTAGLNQPDMVLAVAFWGEGDASGALLFVMPPDAVGFALPELPEEFAGRVPQDPEGMSTTIQAVAASYVDGYDDARQRFVELVGEDEALRHGAPATFVRSRSPGGGL